MIVLSRSKNAAALPTRLRITRSRTRPAASSTGLAVIHKSPHPLPAAVCGGDSRDMDSGPVIGVLSGCGGAGASVLAAVLAAAAERCMLIDCDHLGGGIDVLLGCERVPGPRWRHVRLRGGELDPSVLLDGLPRWRDVSFL